MNKKNLVKRIMNFIMWCLIFYCIFYLHFEYQNWLKEITPEYCKNMVFNEIGNLNITYELNDSGLTWIQKIE